MCPVPLPWFLNPVKGWERDIFLCKLPGATRVEASMNAQIGPDENPGEDSEVIDQVLTERLLTFLNPFRPLGWRREEPPTLQQVLRFRPCGFTPDHQREDEWTVYDWRRLSFFVSEIQAGRSLPPIVLDNVCNRGHIYAQPVLCDGHHRLAAYALMKVASFPVSYSGRLDLLDWLQGDSDALPED